jgi:hypothetical protein
MDPAMGFRGSDLMHRTGTRLRDQNFPYYVFCNVTKAFYPPDHNRLTMKAIHVFGILFITTALILCAGCASSQPAPATPAPTPLPATATIATPVPTATPYPGALALNQLASFGKADRTGTATVYRAEILPNYTWTDPTFNSPHDQPMAGDTAFSTQYGYKTQTPAAGNVFLVAFVQLNDTGTAGLVAPSPGQFIVNYEGNDYLFSSIHGAQITMGNGLGSQYDYDYNTGNVTGFIQPGDSNAAKGFLIYEVPASIDLSKATLVASLDADNRAAWALA